MDDLSTKAAIASQRLNNYTGTDYSGIEALRTEIKDQEQLVKAARAAVTHAKEAYAAAHAQQASSQKEVVGLLERKHSWSAGDLERYMSLIRSEHHNEQAVQAAKDELADTERALEDARSKLEKRERAQYHEEQIWSDTIRRNSTWVTFGLMGVNIFLLLANLVVFEPWRRRKIIREVRTALEEKTFATAVPISPTLEKEVDEATMAESPAIVLEDTARADLLPAGEQNPLERLVAETEQSVPGELSTANSRIASVDEQSPPEASWRGKLKLQIATCRAYLHDLFSEREISLRRVEITTIALEGAAAGVAFMGLLIVLLRPR
ncbi:hypothetical protein B0A49_08749 [Cryomyces minteri]|uniref:Sensitive to high expression protein 9, mitochondrial n=1 Tax=Cryomyces minteri TaxID=331657 RepID=A0A4U0WEX4_9PEZI|nr:hypothetical protein B0A49_08749 [Cryomyces minteri]